MAGDTGHPGTSISIEQHLSRILSSVTALPPVEVPIGQALGRTLALDTVSRVDVPGFDNSSMDGYAARRGDLLVASSAAPVALRVVADIPAGSAANPPLRPGEAARIMTGAPLPDDADCVVPVEDTDAGTTTVLVSVTPQPAAFIRRAATDIRRGDLVLPAGRTLRGTDLAAAAAAGIARLRVHPAPRVGVLSTGDELKRPGDALERGQIYDSNSVLLDAVIAEAGGVAVQLGSVTDDPGQLRATLDRHAGELDAIVTSGGVSVGAYDVVKAVLAPLGVWFGPVRMQPGKPQGFGHLAGSPSASSPDANSPGTSGIPIFALPGNPVSVFVSFEAFVRPALLTMQGRTAVRRAVDRATTTTGWRSPAGRAQYMPAVVTATPEGLAVRPASAGGSGSHLVTSLAGANAFAIIDEDVTEVGSSEQVDVVVFADVSTDTADSRGES